MLLSASTTIYQLKTNINKALNYFEQKKVRNTQYGMLANYLNIDFTDDESYFYIYYFDSDSRKNFITKIQKKDYKIVDNIWLKDVDVDLISMISRYDKNTFLQFYDNNKIIKSSYE